MICSNQCRNGRLFRKQQQSDTRTVSCKVFVISGVLKSTLLYVFYSVVSTMVIQQLRDEMKTLTETVKQQGVHIQTLMSTVARQDIQIKSQVEQLKAQHNQIANMQETVDRQEATITQLKQEIADLSQDAEQSSVPLAMHSNLHSNDSSLRGQGDIIMLFYFN